MNLIQIAQAALVPECSPTGAGGLEKCTTEHLFELFYNIFNFGIFLAGVIVVLMVIWSGFQFMLAQGNPYKLEKAGKSVFNAIVGFVIVLSAWLIVNTIVTVFTDCTGWNINPFAGGLNCL
ncbi:MAG: hypothetical protein HYS87_01230 [Candidatus Colwellbacteria bacterium]|nr:hypothetical protein [Candidatus Colwellbacteria bacterium]